VAELIGRTVSERAHLLVEIAHPEHRDELRRVADSLGRA
jgi:acyl-CoA hydrolase